MALVATRIEAPSEPVALGTKPTARLQLAPAARVVPQAELSVKDALLLPTRDIPEMVSAALPVLVTMTCFLAEVDPTDSDPKLSVDEEVAAVASNPVPESAMDWVPATALSVRVILAESAPLAAGTKATVIWQLPPTATLPLQLL